MEITGKLDRPSEIGYDKKLEIVRYFQGNLCDKIGLLFDKLCDFFRANLHCFTRFQRRKTTLMLFNRQLECKAMIKHLFYNKLVKSVTRKRKRTLVWYDAVTPLTTLLVSEIKMTAHIPWSKVSDVLQGLGKCVIKVRIHCVLYLNWAFFFYN